MVDDLLLALKLDESAKPAYVAVVYGTMAFILCKL